MLLCPWDFLGKNTGVDSHFLLQGIFLTQGSNPSLLHCRWILHHPSYQGSPVYIMLTSKIHNCPQSPQPQATCGDLICCSCGCMREFPSSSLVTQPLVLIFGFGLTSVDCLLVASVTQPLKRRESSSLLVLTCSFGLRRGKGIADTAWMCGEYQLGLKLEGSLHSLKQVVSFPKGVGPELLVPQQSQAAQALRKVWAVTCACSQLGDSCDSWH